MISSQMPARFVLVTKFTLNGTCQQYFDDLDSHSFTLS